MYTLTLEELKEATKTNKISLAKKRQIPTSDDQQMALIIQEEEDIPIKFEDVPEHLFWTEEDPYSSFRRKSAPYRINKKVFSTSKYSLKPNSPIKQLINNTKIVEQKEFIRFMALPQEVREATYGFCKKSDFAKYFHISPNTLSRWSSDEEVLSKIDNEMINFWRHKNNEVIHTLYKAIQKYGDSARIKLWLEKIAKFKDEKIIDSHFTFEWKKPGEDSPLLDEPQIYDVETFNNNEE